MFRGIARATLFSRAFLGLGGQVRYRPWASRFFGDGVARLNALGGRPSLAWLAALWLFPLLCWVFVLFSRVVAPVPPAPGVPPLI